MNERHRALAYALAFIVGLASIGYLIVGFPALLLSGAFIGGLVLWLTTTYQTPIPASKVIVPYLVTVLVFLIHVYEEYLSHIEASLSAMSGFTVSQMNFITIAAFAAPLIWISGAVMMLRGWQFGYFFASTFLFGMMFGEFSHFLFPFLEDGSFHYAAGMYTAVLPISAAWYTFVAMRREMANAKRELPSVRAGAAPAHSR